MSQHFFYPPSEATITGTVTVDQGTTPWIVEDSAAEASLASIDAKLTNPLPVSGPLTDAQLRASPVPVSAASLPLPTGAATEAKQDAQITQETSSANSLTALNARLASGLVPEAFDEQVITYVGATDRINTVEYKLATVTVATLTMSYDGSNRLTGVVKS